MDAEEALEQMRHVQEEPVDAEDWHRRADGILCDLLQSLGYGEIVEEYNKVPRWYA